MKQRCTDLILSLSFGVSWRNKWMLKQADVVITYVTHPSSGVWEFEQMAIKQQKTVIKPMYLV